MENNKEPVQFLSAFVWKQEMLKLLHFLTFTQHHGGAFYLHLIINVRTDVLFDDTVLNAEQKQKLLPITNVWCTNLSAHLSH